MFCWPFVLRLISLLYNGVVIFMVIGFCVFRARSVPRRSLHNLLLPYIRDGRLRFSRTQLTFGLTHEVTDS